VGTALCGEFFDGLCGRSGFRTAVTVGFAKANDFGKAIELAGWQAGVDRCG
jgi:hypothetical protein